MKRGEGVFNGDFGFIMDIDDDERIMKILFDDEREVEYNFNQLDELKLSYATLQSINRVLNFSSSNAYLLGASYVTYSEFTIYSYY